MNSSRLTFLKPTQFKRICAPSTGRVFFAGMEHSGLPRNYSTERLFKPALNEAEAVEALANVKTSKRGNPVDSRRTYWFEVYRHILKHSRYIFVFQNTNMQAATRTAFRADLAKSNLESLSVRNSVFKAASYTQGLGKMSNLFQGQSIIVFSNATDEDSPNLIKDIAKLSLKYKDNLILVGGNLEGLVLTADTFNQVKDMPPKAVLFQQLLGLLSQPASSIASILGQTPFMLAASLEQHTKQMSQ